MVYSGIKLITVGRNRLKLENRRQFRNCSIKIHQAWLLKILFNFMKKIKCLKKRNTRRSEKYLVNKKKRQVLENFYLFLNKLRSNFFDPFQKIRLLKFYKVGLLQISARLWMTFLCLASKKKMSYRAKSEKHCRCGSSTQACLTNYALVTAEVVMVEYHFYLR